MKFIFSIMTLASIAGALMVLYAGAGSLLKVNRSSAEDQERVEERAAGMVVRVAQNSGALANGKINDPTLFGPLKVDSISPPPTSARPGSATPLVAGDGSDLGDESRGYGAGLPQPPTVRPSPWAQPPFPVFPAPVPSVLMPRILPRPTPTPAEEALAVYRKYATPQ